MKNTERLNGYYEKYPIYNLIKFSENSKMQGEILHPLYVATQQIIDKLISLGSKRIAIVLPDDECNIIPLIITKCFYNIQNESEYAGSILDEVEPGQHLRLGKAVVEFLGINKDAGTITFRVERKHPMTVSCPINGIHYMLEKTDGAISTYKVWSQARAEAQKLLDTSDEIIHTLKIKRTVLSKTLTLLTAKNDFYNSIENLHINSYDSSDVITYGEIDFSQSNSYKLHNSGKLNCIPGLSITNKIEDILDLLTACSTEQQVYTIYSALDKFDEITDNVDILKEVLRLSIPFIAFIPEEKFEKAAVLLSLGFELWHWKPSTLKLISENNHISSNTPMFGGLSNKIKHAANSKFECFTVKNGFLKQALAKVYRLSKLLNELTSEIKRFVRYIWMLQNNLTGIICFSDANLKSKLDNDLVNLHIQWNIYGRYYQGQEIDVLIKEIFELYSKFLVSGKDKSQKIIEAISNIPAGASVVILVADNYMFFAETWNFIEKFHSSANIRLIRLSDFYIKQGELTNVDYLFVTWFDKDEYIRIKQTYCYSHLYYVLYDFEARWRNGFVRKFDDQLPHNSVKVAAQKLNIDLDNGYDAIFDKETDDIENVVEDTEEYEEIADFNIKKTIIFSTIRDTSEVSKEAADAVECIPVMLAGDRLAYFYPTHDVIDVTALGKGVLGRAVKKDASRLKKGDKILIRQSDKDIIREKADMLISQDSGSFGGREVTELWSKLLTIYSQGKSISDIIDALNKENVKCSPQQVRYWLSGETIIPRDKNVLRAIGLVASKDESLANISVDYLDKIDIIYETGKIVQGYHQRAGRWLTGELRNKADEIKQIMTKEVPIGIIDGIGEITIYTVDEVLDKEFVPRAKLNRIEEL